MSEKKITVEFTAEELEAFLHATERGSFAVCCMKGGKNFNDEETEIDHDNLHKLIMRLLDARRETKNK